MGRGLLTVTPDKDRALMLVRHQFQLGPFTVKCTPAPIPNNYLLYEIFLKGTLIRKQITYPELADGYLGAGSLSATVRAKLHETDSRQVLEKEVEPTK